MKNFFEEHKLPVILVAAGAILILVPIVIIFLFSLFITYTAEKNMKDQPETTPIESTEWKKYSDPVHGYSFEYPSESKINDDFILKDRKVDFTLTYEKTVSWYSLGVPANDLYEVDIVGSPQDSAKTAASNYLVSEYGSIGQLLKTIHPVKVNKYDGYNFEIGWGTGSHFTDEYFITLPKGVVRIRTVIDLDSNTSHLENYKMKLQHVLDSLMAE